MIQFVALLDPTGNVLDMNRAALQAVGAELSDVEGKPFWTIAWWRLSDDVNKTLRDRIQRAASGSVVRWETAIGSRPGGKQTIVIDASLTPVRDQHGKVAFIVAEARDITARQAVQREMLDAETLGREQAEGDFRLLVQSVVDYAIYLLSPTGVITSWNAGGERIKGYRASEIIGQNFSRFFTEEDRAAGLPAKALQTAADEGKYQDEGWRVRKDGTRFWASVVLDSIRDQDGRLIGFAKVTRDITERREAAVALQEAQQQLLQAQKMEGIGHLTGGVAHDFNNLLTIIIGNLETLQRVVQDQHADTGRLMRLSENAMRGAERAAALTQRLLAFSRQQPLQPKALDVNKLVGGMSDLLRRSLGEQVAIETSLAGELWRVHADPNQLEVAILNLAVNARDAMPDGGRLIIRTSNATSNEIRSAHQKEALAGPYVTISVIDTGCGMPPDVVERAFEPFFTTKDVGVGTGLGLSQVYGFVRQSGGHVEIESKVGKGTIVRIHLPRLEGDTEEINAEQTRPPPKSRAAELILVVEDDPGVRSHTLASLQDLGYRTLDAGTGAAALRLLQEHPDIQMLFTDIVLPDGMNGQQLAEHARRQRPELKVLMTSGYARNAILRDGKVDPGVHLITKPFSFAALAASVRNVLDMPPASSGRVLLVEDETLIQMLAIDQLESLGYKVDTASSATEAMNKLRLNGDFEAAIVDIGLPDRKGDALIEEIREISPAMPIVVASGYGQAAMDKRFKEFERVAVVSKPYAAEQLKAALAAVNVGR